MNNQKLPNWKKTRNVSPQKYTVKINMQRAGKICTAFIKILDCLIELWIKAVL